MTHLSEGLGKHHVCVSQTLTRLDVLPQDFDVLVSVGATLFVVEAEGVQQLMLDGVVVEAALTVQGHLLGITTAADVGVTAALTCLSKLIRDGRNIVWFI